MLLLYLPTTRHLQLDKDVVRRRNSRRQK